MSNFLMLLATSGLIFTATTSSLNSLTNYDCYTLNISAACTQLQEVNK